MPNPSGDTFFAVFGGIYGGFESSIPDCEGKKPYTEDPEGTFYLSNATSTVELLDSTTWWYTGSSSQVNYLNLTSASGWEGIRVTEVGNFSACLYNNRSSCMPTECQAFNVTRPPNNFLEVTATHTGAPVFIRFNTWNFTTVIADWLVISSFPSYLNFTEKEAIGGSLGWNAPAGYHEHCWVYVSAAVFATQAGEIYTCPGTASTFVTSYAWAPVDYGTIKLYLSRRGPFEVGYFFNDGETSSQDLWNEGYICGMNVTALSNKDSQPSGAAAAAASTETELRYEVVPFLDRPSCGVIGAAGIGFDISTAPQSTEYVDVPVDMSFTGYTLAQMQNKTVIGIKVPKSGVHMVDIYFSKSGALLESFNRTVVTSAAHPPHSAVLVAPLGAVPVGAPQNFSFQLRDYYYNAVGEGGHDFDLEISRMSSDNSTDTIYQVDHGGGTYGVGFLLGAPGMAYLGVALGGLHLAGSPFMVYAYEDESNCKHADIGYEVSACAKNSYRYITFGFTRNCTGGVDLPELQKVDCDHTMLQSTIGAAIIALSVIAACINLAWIPILHQFRKRKIIRLAQPLLCKLFAGGCTALCLANISNLGEHSSATCAARPWVLHIPLTFSFACVFAKVWRVHKIFGNKQMKKMKINNKTLLKIIVSILGLEALLLMLATAVETPKPIGTVYTGSFYTYTAYSCQASGGTSFFTTILWVFELVMLIYGCYLAFVTRHYERHLAEGQYIALAIYNMGLLAAVTVLMSLLGIKVQAQLLVQTITITVGTVFATVIIFSPKFLIIYQQGDILDISMGTTQQQRSSIAGLNFAQAAAVSTMAVKAVHKNNTGNAVEPDRRRSSGIAAATAHLKHIGQVSARKYAAQEEDTNTPLSSGGVQHQQQADNAPGPPSNTARLSNESVVVTPPQPSHKQLSPVISPLQSPNFGRSRSGSHTNLIAEVHALEDGGKSRKSTNTTIPFTFNSRMDNTRSASSSGAEVEDDASIIVPGLSSRRHAYN